VKLRALVLADPDIAQVLLELILVDDRPHMRAGLHGIIDNQALEPLGQRLDETVVNALRDDQP
jgi:hypothetical protein